MGYQIPYLLLTIAVATSQALPQPYEDIISQIVKESAEEEPTQNGTACPPMFSLVGDKCLYFASFVQQNQVACRQVCHSLGGELAAIRTATELQEIIEVIEARGLTQMGFWIDGTFDGKENWNFTNGELVPMGTPFWYAAEDSNPSPGNDPTLSCTSISKNSGFLMKDVTCEELFSPLCEHEPVGLIQREEEKEEETDLEAANISCPPFFVDISGNCIAFITWSTLPWIAAKQTCNAITSTGGLLMTEDIEVLRDIYLYIHREGLEGHDFWIGATDEVKEGVWMDEDKEVTIKAPFWGNINIEGLMEPDGGHTENCLALTSAGQHYFRDKDCNANNYNPICTADPMMPL